jgi:hypothetical protein
LSSVAGKHDGAEKNAWHAQPGTWPAVACVQLASSWKTPPVGERETADRIRHPPSGNSPPREAAARPPEPVVMDWRHAPARVRLRCTGTHRDHLGGAGPIIESRNAARPP